jgi:acyl dehydratase
MDAEWCKRQVFGQRVAHGTLILSVAVGSLADEINEVAFSYGYDKVRFIAPVFIGDTITSRAEIVTKREYAKSPDKFGIVDEQVTVSNQRGETVIALVHVYMIERVAQ